MAAIYQTEENSVFLSVGMHSDSSYFEDPSEHVESLLGAILRNAGLRVERTDHYGEGSPVAGMPLGLIAKTVTTGVKMVDQWRTRIEKDRVRANLPLVHVTLKAHQFDTDVNTEKMLMELKEAGISYTLVAMIPGLQKYLSLVLPYLNFFFSVEVTLDNGTSVFLKTQGHEVSERNVSSMITKIKKRPLHSKTFTLRRNLLGYTVLKTEYLSPETI